LIGLIKRFGLAKQWPNLLVEIGNWELKWM
jgi:hypothetical protein